MNFYILQRDRSFTTVTTKLPPVLEIHYWKRLGRKHLAPTRNVPEALRTGSVTAPMSSNVPITFPSRFSRFRRSGLEPRRSVAAGACGAADPEHGRSCEGTRRPSAALRGARVSPAPLPAAPRCPRAPCSRSPRALRRLGGPARAPELQLVQALQQAAGAVGHGRGAAEAALVGLSADPRLSHRRPAGGPRSLPSPRSTRLL